MAKLLPPYIGKQCKSTGEKLLFNIFKNGGFASDWIILHSLNLSQHTKRLYGEIDFLILIPGGGMYVMEVKGGDVKCIDGIWSFTDRSNNTYKSSIGPFNQARDAMFSLRETIKREFGKQHKLTRLLSGFLCSFPHVSFDKHSVEYAPWQILDKDAIQKGVGEFFRNVVFQFIQKHKQQPWFSERDSLPGLDELMELCDFLRGDFERLRPTRDRLKEFDEQVHSYTVEQYKILDSIQINDQSVVQGSAGTGKTMIAIESAIRSAAAGKSVFLTCYNRLIGEWMQDQVEDGEERITVSNLHGYLYELSRGFDYDTSQQGQQEFFSMYLPALLTDIFRKGICKQFDKLIIDEGQDLIRSEYLSLFDSMLAGGLANGNWEIYGDFERQAIYAQLSREEMLELIGRFVKPTNFLLRTNCRNTKQIGEETALVSGFASPPFLLEYLEGIPVEYAFYKDMPEQRELVAEQLRRISTVGLLRGDLIVLSPRKLENSAAQSIPGFVVREVKHAGEYSAVPGQVDFATIQSYKGMERNYVILTDIEDLSGEAAKSLLYVGMSRAKYGLSVMISESMRTTYRTILKRKLAK